VTLTPHPLLVPRSWKRRAIPLLPLWAVRPVQRLSACTRVHFNFTLRSERRQRYDKCKDKIFRVFKHCPVKKYRQSSVQSSTRHSADCHFNVTYDLRCYG